MCSFQTNANSFTACNIFSPSRNVSRKTHLVNVHVFLSFHKLCHCTVAQIVPSLPTNGTMRINNIASLKVTVGNSLERTLIICPVRSKKRAHLLKRIHCYDSLVIAWSTNIHCVAKSCHGWTCIVFTGCNPVGNSVVRICCCNKTCNWSTHLTGNKAAGKVSKVTAWNNGNNSRIVNLAVMRNTVANNKRGIHIVETLRQEACYVYGICRRKAEFLAEVFIGKGCLYKLLTVIKSTLNLKGAYVTVKSRKLLFLER